MEKAKGWEKIDIAILSPKQKIKVRDRRPE